MKQITVTQDFKQDQANVLGSLVIAPNKSAETLYTLLKEHPDWFTFEVGYTIDEQGNKQLTEISLVSKHVKYGKES